MAQGAPAVSRWASRAREPGTSVASSRCLMGTWPSAAQTSEGWRIVLDAGGTGMVSQYWRKREDLLTFPVCALRAQDFEDVNAAAAVGGLQDHYAAIR
jgi:hypothetical protein